MVKKAVCLISGGLDSCVTAYIAKKQCYNIYAISFNYSQLHKKELEHSKKIAKVVEAHSHIIIDVDFNKFGKSSLLNKSTVSIDNHDLNDIGKNIPSTYVPARNTVFLSLALSYAESIDADAIFIGANAVDYPGYPDCRPEYIQIYQKMADLATKRGVEGRPIKIKAPLLSLKKSEIITKGIELKVSFTDTWSCYRGNKLACGLCDSCILRLKGFKEVGIKDPIQYEFYPDWYNW